MGETISNIAEVDTNSAVSAHLDDIGNTGHADLVSRNRTITRIEVANGKVVTMTQVKGVRSKSEPVFPRAGSGIGHWLHGFFGKAIELSFWSDDPNSMVLLVQAVNWLIVETKPKGPISKTFSTPG